MMTTTVSPQVEKYGAGMCVAVIERNGYHDSDFSGIFAVRKDDGGFAFVHEVTGSTAYAGGFIAHEDATDEVLTAYRARRDEVLDRLAADRAARAERVPDDGKFVVIVNPVTRGKNKTAAGVRAKVTRRVVNDFDSHSRKASGLRTYRVHVALLDGDARTMWLDEDRVRVIGHEDEALSVNTDNVDAVIAGAWPAR